MKGILILHVRTKKKTIYSKSFSRVKNNIEKAFQAMANELRGRVREVWCAALLPFIPFTVWVLG